jgi:hypothetical protein
MVETPSRRSSLLMAEPQSGSARGRSRTSESPQTPRAVVRNFDFGVEHVAGGGQSEPPLTGAMSPRSKPVAWPTSMR